MSEMLTRFSREIFEVTDESLIIVLCTLVLVATALVVYWLYNRRRLHELGHQIPAAVLKSYLDSIIQNSTALKSSLFRGGGLEIGEGIPSVVSTNDLPSTSSISASGAASSEELNQKIAQIAALSKELSEKDLVITELEFKLKEASSSEPAVDNSSEVNALNSEIRSLKEKIANLESAPHDGGGSPELEAKLSDITKERDELKERLLEYEIIEEDLANLKRLQQENDQLKNKIASLESGEGNSETPQEKTVSAAEPDPEPESEPAAEEVPLPEAMSDGPDLEAEMAAAITDSAPPPAVEEVTDADNGDVPANEGEQKSATELLSEFEKMLG